MGPQLYRCGNIATQYSVDFDYYMLQWGRNFIVAEIMPKRLNAIAKAEVLQWGRNFIVAEINALA